MSLLGKRGCEFGGGERASPEKRRGASARKKDEADVDDDDYDGVYFNGENTYGDEIRF